MNRTLVISGFVLTTVALAATARAQSVYAYLSGPNLNVVPASIPSTTTETFNGVTAAQNADPSGTYSSAIGTYTGTFASVADDQYGNNTSNYFSIGAQSNTTTPVTLTFGSAVKYFGLAYCAGDGNNGFTFYDGSNKLIGRYSTATLLSAIPMGGTVKNLDNTTYNNNLYYGKPNGSGPSTPNTGMNNGQPYAFVNFFAGAGTTIKTIVFDNSGTTGSGFESDNHTISSSATLTPPTSGDYVLIGGVASPDAGSLPLILLSAAPFGIATLRRRRK